MSTSITSIDQFMNQADNQNYRELRFYNTGFGDITHDELNVSKFGAVHISRGNVKNIYPKDTPIAIDEINRRVYLGTATSYVTLEFKYENVFYI